MGGLFLFLSTFLRNCYQIVITKIRKKEKMPIVSALLVNMAEDKRFSM